MYFCPVVICFLFDETKPFHPSKCSNKKTRTLSLHFFKRNDKKITMESPEIFGSPSLIRIQRHPKRNQVSHEKSATSIELQDTTVCPLHFKTKCHSEFSRNSLIIDEKEYCDFSDDSK
jgi:hypothetical protein